MILWLIPDILMNENTIKRNNLLNISKQTRLRRKAAKVKRYQTINLADLLCCPLAIQTLGTQPNNAHLLLEQTAPLPHCMRL